MAPNKSPAFQFYPKDFTSGTATMSLQEVGAYVRLLCYAWDSGSVPNDANERACIMVCSKAQEAVLWTKVGKKFTLHDDVYLNERMEEERKKQSDYRRRQSDKGKASAANRKPTEDQQDGNRGSTVVESRLQPEGNTAVASASSSSGKEQKQQQQRAPALIISPAEYERKRQFCAFVGSRIEVPNGLHAQLRKGHGGVNPERELHDWYLALDEQAETEGWRIPQGDEFYPWLRDLYSRKFPPTPVNGAKSVTQQIEDWAKS